MMRSRSERRPDGVSSSRWFNHSVFERSGIRSASRKRVEQPWRKAVLNKFRQSGQGEASAQYLDGDFRVISPGTYVRCAVTDARIPLDELKYWSVDLQEAYALPSAVLQRHYPGAFKSSD
ncbi:conserved hypothetical protein [Nitrobacter winogradskyi Nb-255]|uniref:DUF2093 domain-containing protein n=1 Tax=Nitrobacter winogradskyi (strain ATCC 25391 / DSM 10237 / CIP 104748 / NCIMB 11846 / Nb-255) TaxID=323098 RepID=Q3SPI4_NITWN|nr:conserved hypothetical protein [Nitrobacter winogradskyi Nb-255]